MMQTFYTSCNFLDVWAVSVVISCMIEIFGLKILFFFKKENIMKILTWLFVLFKSIEKHT